MDISTFVLPLIAAFPPFVVVIIFHDWHVKTLMLVWCFLWFMIHFFDIVYRYEVIVTVRNHDIAYVLS